MLVASLTAFAIAIVYLYPIQIRNQNNSKTNPENQTELEKLFSIRISAQNSSLQSAEYKDSKWKSELELAHATGVREGVSLIPIIDYLIKCERDEQNLVREFANRSATAKGASLTLIAMPLLMWLLSVAIGIDTFGFLLSPFGFFVMLIGFSLTVLSRVIIKWFSSKAIAKPVQKSFKAISPETAGITIFLAIFAFQTSYFGFVIALFCGLILHSVWSRIPIQDLKFINFVAQDDQHFKLVLLAGMLDAGFAWPKALEVIDDAELGLISKRISMGVSADIAFGHSQSWRRVGELISASIRKGSRLSNELRLLSDEYRQSSFAYRLQYCEKIASRLIIPVNLLQLPSFILVGLVPMIAPLVFDTFNSFHI